MRLFLKDSRFSAWPTELPVPWSQPVWLKPYQIVLWVSLSNRGLGRPPDVVPRLPALLDTGHNHNLSLREEHLLASGLVPHELEWRGVPLRVRDASFQEWDIPRLLVDVWIHSNLPRLARRPFPLRLGAVGAACYLEQGPVRGPFLPIVGLRALCVNSVALELGCQPSGGTVSLRVPALS
jgi:hypothetical protein